MSVIFFQMFPLKSEHHNKQDTSLSTTFQSCAKVNRFKSKQSQELQPNSPFLPWVQSLCMPHTVFKALRWWTVFLNKWFSWQHTEIGGMFSSASSNLVPCEWIGQPTGKDQIRSIRTLKYKEARKKIHFNTLPGRKRSQGFITKQNWKIHCPVRTIEDFKRPWFIQIQCDFVIQNILREQLFKNICMIGTQRNINFNKAY